MRSEEEVNQMIEEMMRRNKGRYITQGVSFNKTCPRQMGLLKKALMESVSFSGLTKEMLALRFEGNTQPNNVVPFQPNIPDTPKTKNVGNFI